MTAPFDNLASRVEPMSYHREANATAGPPPTVITHLDGVRFAASIRSHTVIVDQPQHGGGEDLGPTPLELLGASLGTCVALYVRKFLATRHLTADGLRVEVVQHGASNPSRTGRFDVRIILPEAIPSVYRPMLEAVARVCPVHNTLAHGAEVQVALDIPALQDATGSPA